MKKSLTKDQFVDKARIIHGDKYNYDITVYIRGDKKVEITCPIHGNFWIRGSTHLEGQGCSKCGRDKANTTIKKNSEESFFEVSNIVHNNFYDYSKSVYINHTTQITITCPIHGDFKQAPREHSVGHGCKICGKKKAGYVIDTESFINKASKIHNNFYDYSKTYYPDNTNTAVKVSIICPIHGEFEQSANSHLKGHGCQKCGKEKFSEQTTLLFSEFITRSNKKHNNRYKYIYDSSSYVSLKSDVEIICSNHGIFTQKAYNHINGSGCIKCNNSRGEEEILSFLISEYPNMEYICQFKDNWLEKLSFDFFIPSLQIAIEYQGEQHHKPIDLFGGEESFKKQVERDIRKRNLSILNNVLLVEINYNNKEEDMKNLKIIINNKIAEINSIKL